MVDKTWCKAIGSLKEREECHRLLGIAKGRGERRIRWEGLLQRHDNWFDRWVMKFAAGRKIGSLNSNEEVASRFLNG